MAGELFDSQFDEEHRVLRNTLNLTDSHQLELTITRLSFFRVAELEEQHLTADHFALRAGHYLGEINAIHPFREGNGRTQREFIRSLALHAGHRLVWTGLEPEENSSASRLSYASANSEALAALIRKRLS